ncbi:MAG: hypothetical protein FLDDKLPJ_00572 [Phycisphaerae bacterium]|nr:hypothetical protein [Phycisphaerae bacterium]
MRRARGIRLAVLAAVLAFSPALQGAIILLKDGSMIEGRIIKELSTATTIRVRTPFEERLINRRDIDRIFDEEAIDQTGLAKFEELPEAVRAVFNARADYRLGNYARVIERIEPFLQKEQNPVLRSEMTWLIIESKERFAKWDEVKPMLEALEKDGTPQDKLRAKAHREILEDNAEWDYSLRRVDKAWSRNFLPQDMRADAQDPNALADATMMRKALEEYCSQLVRNEKYGVETLRERMNPRKTMEAVRELPPAIRADDVLKRMPYLEELKLAETSVLKAQAVLPGYADAFQLDLIRAEAEHLLFYVLGGMLEEALISSPLYQPLPQTLDAATREQWRQACDEWLARTKPTEIVGEYLLNKLMGYPEQMRLEYHLLRDVYDRLQEMRESIMRQRNR